MHPAEIFFTLEVANRVYPLVERIVMGEEFDRYHTPIRAIVKRPRIHLRKMPAIIEDRLHLFKTLQREEYPRRELQFCLKGAGPCRLREPFQFECRKINHCVLTRKE